MPEIFADTIWVRKNYGEQGRVSYEIIPTYTDKIEGGDVFAVYKLEKVYRGQTTLSFEEIQNEHA